MRRPPIQSVLILAALATPSFAQADYIFQVDTAATLFTWSGTTSIGDIDEQPGNFTLLGTTVMTMDGGGNPVGAGAFPGAGDALITPDITGVIPNPLPFLPPLATVHLQNAHLQLSSSPFVVDNAGNFSTLVSMTILQGTMIVDDINGGNTVTDLSGNTSAPSAANGSVIWNGTDYVLALPVNSTFPFDDPSSGISGSILLVGTMISKYQPIAPAVFCTSLANSSGNTGTIAFSGAPSMGAGSPTLHVTQVPANTFGLLFYGSAQTTAPFGNGVRCVAGSLQRFTPVSTGATGSVNQLIDNSGLPATGPVSVGDTRNFQFWFRDVPAGGSLFNTSDAISVTYAP